MLTALLEEAANKGNIMDSLLPLIILIVFVAIIIVFYFISSKKRKKQEQDAKDLINAVKPGNKVKTIGGICGIVVEVDDEENTFVLETGTEVSGKSYIKFDKQAIYQTDAVVEKKETPVETTGETVSEEITESAAETPVANVEPANAEIAEESAEPAPVVKTKKSTKKDKE